MQLPIRTPQSRSRPTTEAAAIDDDAIDDAIDLPRSGPLRRCVVTREQGERSHMLRFVVGPGDVIVPDLAARLPGRGIWLSARADVIHSARTRQAFSRAAKARVEVPVDLAALVTSGLLRRIGDLIGFARRAGQAVAGYQKAHEWLAAGKAELIIQARDGSTEERARFLGGRTDVAVIAPLEAARLGTIFGRETAVHVAVSAGKLARSLRIEAERYAGVTGMAASGSMDVMSAAPDDGISERAQDAAARDRDADA